MPDHLCSQSRNTPPHTRRAHPPPIGVGKQDRMFPPCCYNGNVSEEQAIAGRKAGGKSELHRAGCRVTPGEGDLKESATENIPRPRVIPGRKVEKAG